MRRASVRGSVLRRPGWHQEKVACAALDRQLVFALIDLWCLAEANVPAVAMAPVRCPVRLLLAACPLRLQAIGVSPLPGPVPAGKGISASHPLPTQRTAVDCWRPRAQGDPSKDRK